MPDLKILHIIFHPDISEHELVTVLNSLRASHGALPYLILGGTVPPLNRHMRFPTKIGILRIEAENFGDHSVPLLTESAQFTELHSLYLTSTGITTIKRAHTENAFHPLFRMFVS
jgi:hypothetical protein